MSYLFKNALVRKPGKSILNAISSRGLKPNYQKIITEHQKYINILKFSGVNVIILKSLDNFPDSVFIEDPAIAFKEFFILLRPAKLSRFGERVALEKDILCYFENIFYVKSGKVEGGDILRINNHFIIGISERTNSVGAKNLSDILVSIGATVQITLTPKDVLHFKSDCSLIDEETIFLTKKIPKNIFNKKYKIILVPEGEEIAANSLRINKNLLIPSGFKKTEQLLSRDYNLISIDVSEISKVDAGLSCMSLRW
jgi:dimethylargininase